MAEFQRKGDNILDDLKSKKNSDKTVTIHYIEIIKTSGIDTRCEFCGYPFTVFVDTVNRCPECGAVHLLDP